MYSQDLGEGFLVVGGRSSLPQSSYQLPWVGLEGCGDADDVVQAEVALASFDLADVGPVQAAALG